jgi:hypothetical protein
VAEQPGTLWRDWLQELGCLTVAAARTSAAPWGRGWVRGGAGGRRAGGRTLTASMIRSIMNTPLVLRMTSGACTARQERNLTA